MFIEGFKKYLENQSRNVNINNCALSEGKQDECQNRLKKSKKEFNHWSNMFF